MAVPVMHVREMGMRMSQGGVSMPVSMVRSRWNDRAVVIVLMMLVVTVLVQVFHHIMLVRMFVAFGQVQPDPQPHQRAADQ